MGCGLNDKRSRGYAGNGIAFLSEKEITMAKLRDPKRYYYAMRSKYFREMNQIGQKINFALSEEEDALYWDKMIKVLKRWRALKAPDGIKVREEAEPWMKWRFKPIFNDDYVFLTMKMREIYAQKGTARTEQERDAIDETVRRLEKRRNLVTTFTEREC